MTSFSSGPESDEQIPAFLERLGLPGLIDVHVHFMPHNVLEKVWAFFDAHGANEHTPWPITYREDEDRRIAALAELGVRRYPSLNYAHKPGMAAWLNEYSRRFADARTPALRSATFYPEPSAGADVAAALAQGVQIFKLHVQVGDFDPNDRLLDESWALLQDAGVPVVIHAGSGPHPGRHTGIEPIERLLRRFPGLQLVIAHAGLPEYLPFARLAADYPGVYLDTTMLATDYTQSFAPMPAGYRQVLGQLGDKVVLGSDFPNIPYPYSHQLQALHRLQLGDHWLRGVLWANPARLLGLDPRTGEDTGDSHHTGAGALPQTTRYEV